MEDGSVKGVVGANSALVHATDGTHVRAPSPSFRDFASHLKPVIHFEDASTRHTVLHEPPDARGILQQRSTVIFAH
jgi:hypothetical protein